MPGASLIHATVIVRHGDRSAIGRIPKAARGVFPCAEPSAVGVARAAELLAPARSSAACVLAGGGVDLDACKLAALASPPLTNATDRALRAWGVARVVGETCGKAGGELSSVGWAQLRATGAALGRAYAPLLRGDLDAAPTIAGVPLQVVSTDTGRTALSAAAFMTGLVDGDSFEGLSRTPQSGGDGSRAGTATASVTVTSVGDMSETTSALSASTTTASASASWLRGAALPLPLNIMPREDDPMLWPKKAYVCARAAVLQHHTFDEIFQHQVRPPSLAARLAHLTGTPADSLPTAEECADDVATRSCHGHALPCWKIAAAVNTTSEGKKEAGGERCLLPQDAAALIARCDQGYAFRYANEVTRMLSFPVLQQLTDQLVRASRRAVALAVASATGGGGGPSRKR